MKAKSSYLFDHQKKKIRRHRIRCGPHMMWLKKYQLLLYYYYHFTSSKFFTPVLIRGHSPESEWLVSRTLRSIPNDFCNAEVRMVMIHPLISNPLSTIPSAPSTISTSVTFMFHRFSNSLPRSRYLSILSLSFIFTLWSQGQQNPLEGGIIFRINKHKGWSSVRN